MSTVKFDAQKDIDELQARIYLDTNIKLTKKQIVEIFFKFGKLHYNEIIANLKSEQRPITDDLIDDIINNSYDWGVGSEKSSMSVDEVLYQRSHNKKRD